MNQVDSIFDNLDRWRHIPSYQLERRADVFFSAYLAEIIEDRFEMGVAGFVPEFPVRIGTIHPGSNSNQSFKIDYLVKMKDENVVLLVELKTDLGSRRGKQDDYLKKAKETGIQPLLQGLLEIYTATRAKRKYRCLLNELCKLDLLAKASETRYLVPEHDYDIQIVYLQPTAQESNEIVISFDQMAKVISEHQDILSQRFARSLVDWSNTAAGEC